MHHRIYNYGDKMSLFDKLFFSYRDDKSLKMKISTKINIRPLLCTIPAIVAVSVISIICFLM